MDTLHVTGIRAYGYIGDLPEEQKLGQWYEVDFTIWLDISKAGSSDNLADTFDYSSIIKQIQELIQTARFRLIERLAEAIAQQVLAQQKIEQVRVRLTKLTPPVPDFSGHVTVEIVRTHSSIP